MTQPPVPSSPAGLVVLTAGEVEQIAGLLDLLAVLDKQMPDLADDWAQELRARAAGKAPWSQL
ncbi:hypothetical protein [Streptomyces sp. NRRL S-350]|uniref:hypothetical protein n=1 Tax=Streptomyces sp. NRRL S-350 TaxID=1463902 RepID=UPI0004C0ED75|nr:hypothetical protein [Streptomyces sp. NRRL S-350]